MESEGTAMEKVDRLGEQSITVRANTQLGGRRFVKKFFAIQQNSFTSLNF